MTDEVLIREWKAGDDRSSQSTGAIETAIARDRAARNRERLAGILWIACFAPLCAILLWCAASAVTPVVRGGYALMTVGVGLILFAQFVYFLWDREAQPEARDSVTQIGVNVTLLRQQAALMRSAAVWCAPIFIGAALVGWRVYVEQSHAGAVVLWLALALAWVGSVFRGRDKGRELDTRRAALEQILSDLKG